MTHDELPSLRIGEIVLRTAGYAAMKAWYSTVLRIDPYYERGGAVAGAGSEAPRNGPGSGALTGPGWAAQVRLCFFRLVLEHPYQQVVAIFDTPGATHPGMDAAGLHHIQLRDPSTDVLASRYRSLKAGGIEPFRAMDHGPNTSLYYRDPDDNVVELAAPNHPSVERYLEAIASDEFRANPSGRPIDLAQLDAARLVTDR